MNDPLIWLRACHFAATASLAGALLFHDLVGRPAVQTAPGDAQMPAVMRRRLAGIVWISFALVLVTGAGWFVVQAAQMADVPRSAVFAGGAAWDVLVKTDFGNVSVARIVLAALFPAALLLESRRVPPRPRTLSTALAICLAGTLAFAGHAAAGEDTEGWLHLGADILHLVTAAAWLGALVPLATVLHAARAKNDAFSLAIARAATTRFSSLGIASVGTLVITGLVNTWVLAGSVEALVSTDYGRLLSLKLLLFLAMLAVAAVNRLVLTPRLLLERREIGNAALRTLRNNSLIEATLGLLILCLVGILGTLPPGSHE